MAVHYAVGISRQRNSGYRPSRVNIMACTRSLHCLSTPDPSLSPTHLSIRRGRATTTHYTHHHVSLMESRNITLERRKNIKPRDAMHKRGLCRYAVSVCMCVCLSRSWIMSKWINVSSKFFYHRVATPLYFFFTKRDGDIPTGSPPP